MIDWFVVIHCNEKQPYVARWRRRPFVESRRCWRGTDRPPSRRPPASTAGRRALADGRDRRAAPSAPPRAPAQSRSADRCPAAADRRPPARRTGFAEDACLRWALPSPETSLHYTVIIIIISGKCCWFDNLASAFTFLTICGQYYNMCHLKKHC